MSAKGSLVRGGLQVAAACFGRGFVNVPADTLIQYSTVRLYKFVIFCNPIQLTKLAH